MVWLIVWNYILLLLQCYYRLLTSRSVYNNDNSMGELRAVFENRETWLDRPTLRMNSNKYSTFFSFIVDKCANCHINAECIYGRCRCMKGYIGTGYVCEKGKWKRGIVGLCFLVVLISNRISYRGANELICQNMSWTIIATKKPG